MAAAAAVVAACHSTLREATPSQPSRSALRRMASGSPWRRIAARRSCCRWRPPSRCACSAALPLQASSSHAPRTPGTPRVASCTPLTTRPPGRSPSGTCGRRASCIRSRATARRCATCTRTPSRVSLRAVASTRACAFGRPPPAPRARRYRPTRDAARTTRWRERCSGWSCREHVLRACFVPLVSAPLLPAPRRGTVRAGSAGHISRDDPLPDERHDEVFFNGM
mmetsp:Transcript_58429/g.155345  ORF Transcript_58429/g.155345 Transcript_58429/m.155345 type:complete len:224 (+) Transcript_58429:78-749(+)